MADSTEFSTLNLDSALLSNLEDLGYSSMTTVQSHALPFVIEGRDVLARAKTGSGKTATFGLGLLNRLLPERFETQALILCPTRELADQVANEIRRLARAIANIKVLSICGGVPLRAQLKSLRRSPHILVGTPGRIHKHLRDAAIDLGNINTLVLDEADRMLDMGFIDEMNAILAYLPKQRQTLLFSATYPESVAAMSAMVQRNPEVVDVTDNEAPAMIAQSWSIVTRENRDEQLLRALRAWGGELNLVFCNTKADCAAVADYLLAKGIGAIALHGDLDQKQRNQMLVRFSNRSASVLVATDVAARGLDVNDIQAVFNYELPTEPSAYIHRIGRTGRAGSRGVAVSLVEPREMPRLMAIESEMADTTLRERNIPVEDRRAAALKPTMTTIQVSGGKKNKLRPGDLLGALTAENRVPGKAVGSIDLFDSYAYIAVKNNEAKKALRQLAERPIKGKKYRARICR